LANWSGKKIVMTIDEFDKVLDDDVIRLDTLCGIKADLHKNGTTDYNVQSVVIIGPLSVIKATTKDATEDATKAKKGKKQRFLSLFNVSEAVSSPKFLLAEVQALYTEFAYIQTINPYYLIFSDKKKCQKDGNWIPKSLKAFHFMALVGFCGKILDTKFERCPSLTDWVAYSRCELFRYVLEWTTASRIAKTAAKQDNKRLLGKFLCTEGALKVCMERVNCVSLVYFFQRYSLITCRCDRTKQTLARNWL
jgi:hypothetical protein